MPEKVFSNMIFGVCKDELCFLRFWWWRPRNLILSWVAVVKFIRGSSLILLYSLDKGDFMLNLAYLGPRHDLFNFPNLIGFCVLNFILVLLKIAVFLLWIGSSFSILELGLWFWVWHFGWFEIWARDIILCFKVFWSKLCLISFKNMLWRNRSKSYFCWS